MPANTGSQNIDFIFHQVASTGGLNKRNFGVEQTGIYSGGWASVVNSTTVTISALVAVLADGSYQVRAETTTSVNITVSSATPYVVLRWTYTGVLNNDYMELLAVATPAANDLVAFKCTFTGGGVLNGATYSDTSYPRSNPNVLDQYLKVEPRPASLRVRVRGGRFQTRTGTVVIADQETNLFTAPITSSKVYLVYIDTTTNLGTILVDESGVESATPVAPSYNGKLVLAEVTLSYTDIGISASQIRDVRPWIVWGQQDPDGVTIAVSSVNHKLYVKGGISYDKLTSTYDSGWFAVTYAQNYIKTHGLGSSAIMCDVLFAPDSGGSPDTSRISRVNFWHDTGGQEIGPSIQSVTSTQFTVYTGAYSAACPIDPTSKSPDLSIRSGWYRIMAMRIA